MTAAMPRPAAETAEQTVSAIIRSSWAWLTGRAVRPFHPAPLPSPGATLPADIRDISGSPPSQVPVAGPVREAARPGPARTRPAPRAVRPASAAAPDWVLCGGPGRLGA
ncbi:hypothetical protein GCM10023336_12760 [Streptomyces similanensis]|uniref:Uncharacterized protein n=1 Tax=Streptomyces similanensis TaxID=1274988 RepID=A0ABP9K1H0_9ACTN